jgi:hypothetical protein
VVCLHKASVEIRAEGYFAFARRRKTAEITSPTIPSPTAMATAVSQSDVQKLTPVELNAIARMRKA